MRPGREGPGRRACDAPTLERSRSFNEARARRPGEAELVDLGDDMRRNASMRPGREGPGRLAYLARLMTPRTSLATRPGREGPGRPSTRQSSRCRQRCFNEARARRPGEASMVQVRSTVSR